MPRLCSIPGKNGNTSTPTLNADLRRGRTDPGVGRAGQSRVLR